MKIAFASPMLTTAQIAAHLPYGLFAFWGGDPTLFGNGASGSGIFLEDQYHRFRLVGIFSASATGQIAFAVDLRPHRDWIFKTVGSSS